ncbi:hypothetical protein H6504_00175 [Candidatus Woesearchaeota archaeon]|nr:hypothetical protein [Candidatus Woesearchaeota archaeon]
MSQLVLPYGGDSFVAAEFCYLADDTYSIYDLRRHLVVVSEPLSHSLDLASIVKGPEFRHLHDPMPSVERGFYQMMEDLQLLSRQSSAKELGDFFQSCAWFAQRDGAPFHAVTLDAKTFVRKGSGGVVDVTVAASEVYLYHHGKDFEFVYLPKEICN